MVDRAGLEMLQSLFHFVETIGVAQKAGQIKPRPDTRMTGDDGGAIFALRRGFVFLFLGDSRSDPMRHRWIQGHNSVRLGASLVLSPAHDAGSLEIEFGQIGPRFPTLGI